MSSKKDEPQQHEHIITNKIKLLTRVKKLKGQLEGVEKALEQDKDCKQILLILSSIRGALGGLMAEVMESHVIEHLFGNEKLTQKELSLAQELVESIKVFVK